MFTGIIEEVGSVREIRRGARSCVISVGAKKALDSVRVGDSIAVNGVCLTVTSFDSLGFCADVMPETLNRSSLGSLRQGGSVNLERAMPANGRFDGHIVAGHIDGTGTVATRRRDDNALLLTIRAAPAIMRYIIEKGSIAVNGVSLTVASVRPDSFTVSIIPHTADATTLGGLKTGDAVNLENDCIGKYVEKLLAFGKYK